MKRLVLAGAVVLSIVGRLSAAEEPWLVYAATRVDKAPVIDGRLSDPCWQGIERSRSLTCIGGAAAPVATTGMVCWDDQNLYIAMICAEPQMAAIQQERVEQRLQPFYESVEIFIDAAYDRHTCLQFRVDISGNRDTHVGADFDATLEKRWTGAAAQGQNEWTVELAIPWTLLADGRPAEKTIWGLNLNRNRAIATDGGWTCWSDTKGPFLAPSHFGDLVFFPYPVFLRSYFSDTLQSVCDEIAGLNRRSPMAAANCGSKFAAIRAEHEQFLKSLESAPIARGEDAAAPYARGLEQQRKLASLQDEMMPYVIRDLGSASAKRP